jgi:hypothetical protein
LLLLAFRFVCWLTHSVYPFWISNLDGLALLPGFAHSVHSLTEWNQDIMTATDRSAKAVTESKPHSKPSQPESVILPVMDTYDPETGRVMEISYARNDANSTSSELPSIRRSEKKSLLARVWGFFRR